MWPLAIHYRLPFRLNRRCDSSVLPGIMRYRREATSAAFAEEFLDYSNQLLQGENRNEVQLDTIERRCRK